MTTKNGEDKLIAVARHIAQTLGHADNTMTDDILQIFSSFDNRLREKLTQNITVNKNSSLDHTVKNLDRRISSYLVGDDPIWADHDDAVAFLDTVDELIEVIQEWSDVSSDENVTSCLDRAEELLRKCCVKLEDEFRVLVDRVDFSGGVDFFEGGGGGGTKSDEDEDEDEDEDVAVAEVVKDFDITIDAIPVRFAI